MPKADNAIYCWDITWKYIEDEPREEVQDWCETHCDKWAFQLEKGQKTGYMHWQLRVSLITKARVPPKLSAGARYSPTSNENRNNFDYVTKDHTRLEGPWKWDEFVEKFIPWHLKDKELSLWPWQQVVWDSANIENRNERQINVIVDEIGCQGKSVISSLMDLHGRGYDITAWNDFKIVTQSLQNILSTEKNRDPKVLIFDLERGRNQQELAGLYTAIERIKKGKVEDWRYKHQKWWYHPPVIWVFMNTMPLRSLCTNDRWVFWTINPESKSLEALAL